jgi:hypothetical protein
MGAVIAFGDRGVLPTHHHARLWRPVVAVAANPERAGSMVPTDCFSQWRCSLSNRTLVPGERFSFLYPMATAIPIQHVQSALQLS